MTAVFKFIPSLSLACALLAGATLSQAGVFEIAVSPARFEVSAKSGGRLGQSLEIFNQDSQATELVVKTLDWDYTERGELKFYDELRPGSCREWVTLERPRLKVPARGKSTYRFQIDVPAGAPAQECRLMLAIEGAQPVAQPAVQSGGVSVSLPVNGRIGVAVYVAINGAQPVLKIDSVTTLKSAGKPDQPAVIVSNSGNAHGRLDGALDARDANGQTFEMTPDNSPIMPGQTRTIVLQPRQIADMKPLTVALPIKTTGTLDWDNGSFKVDAEFK